MNSVSSNRISWSFNSESSSRLDAPINSETLQTSHRATPTLKLPRLTEMVEESLRLELQFRKVAPQASKRTLVRAYNASHLRLLECAREWNQFVAGVIHCSVERRPFDMPDGDAKAADVAAGLVSLLGALPTVGPPCTTAAMVALPADKLYQALKDDLDALVAKLAADFLSTLHQGFQQALFGPITWIDEEICEFKYFTAPLLYVNTERQATFMATHTSVRDTHHFQHRRGYHQQHLMEAQIVPGLPPQGMLPPRLRPLTELLPHFLRGLVATVEGLLIAERVVEWDTGTSQTTHDTVIPHPQVMLDPAIVIGPYVLAGWTDRDFSHAGSLASTARRWARRTRSTVTNRLSFLAQ